jgi:hypothetical protein
MSIYLCNYEEGKTNDIKSYSFIWRIEKVENLTYKINQVIKQADFLYMDNEMYIELSKEPILGKFEVQSIKYFENNEWHNINENFNIIYKKNIYDLFAFSKLMYTRF